MRLFRLVAGCLWLAIALAAGLSANHRFTPKKASCIQYAAASGATKGLSWQSVERYTELDNLASLRIAGFPPQNAENPETVGFLTAVLGATRPIPRLATNQLQGKPGCHESPRRVGPAKVRAAQWFECGIVLIGRVRLAKSMGRTTMRLG